MNGQTDCRSKLKEGGIAGLKKGWGGFVWMMKIVIPISLFTSVLDWSGLLGRLDFLLKPLMGIFSLPPTAALPPASPGVWWPRGGAPPPPCPRQRRAPFPQAPPFGK